MLETSRPLHAGQRRRQVAEHGQARASAKRGRNRQQPLHVFRRLGRPADASVIPTGHGRAAQRNARSQLTGGHVQEVRLRLQRLLARQAQELHSQQPAFAVLLHLNQHVVHGQLETINTYKFVGKDSARE